MDIKLLEAIQANDTPTLISLFQANEGVLEQRTADSLDTALHLAAKFGHVDLASEIVTLCPELVAAQNKMLETPIHEACRHGSAEVLKLILTTNPRAACKLNSENKLAFFMACSNGHLDVVNLFLNHPGMLGLEENVFDPTCVHVAAKNGHMDAVIELLNACPDFARTIDENGNSLLHYTCVQGHREATRMLINCDASLTLHRSINGYIPVHMASMNGKVAVLEELVLMASVSFRYDTNEGESVFHLAVRHGQYDALVYLVHTCNGTSLIHYQDLYGNTILHVAVSGGRHQIAEYLIRKTKVHINARNLRGLTALDILDQAKDSAKNRRLEAKFVKAGGRRSIELLSRSPAEERTNSQRLPIMQGCIATELEMPIMNETVSPESKSSPRFSLGTSSRISSPQFQDGETFDCETYRRDSSLFPPNMRQHKHLNKGLQENIASVMSRRVRSRQNPPAPAQAHFCNPRARELYTQNFSTRSPIVEREVLLGELSETVIPRIFESRQWLALTIGHPTLSVELVKEFYSNIAAISDDGSFEVSLRNIVFRVTPDHTAESCSHYPHPLNVEHPPASSSQPSTSQPSTSQPSSSQPHSSAPGLTEPSLQRVIEYLARLEARFDARFDSLDAKVNNLQQLVTQRFNDIEERFDDDGSQPDGDDDDSQPHGDT
ncbi:ankyrin repeat-containing protein At5g02620-like [Juglans microcarpa x Juglans regia]|uniref:ankyrin repeat-containing protein At5g02620-like n=1 Tax=Juglans microcarpa x Juglans regia TaxID=2249226 RepID=UPI001B7E34AA|nr:ankyrin repeat-containing protein At5g02620-like [Juglans microcarpa x Juglans regia]